MIVAGVVIQSFIDGGHVYTTLWRAHSRAHWALFVGVLVLCWAWLSTAAPYFWSALLYFTAFHHVRQIYGFSRWYQALNQVRVPSSDNWLYLLLILPIVAFHFKPGAVIPFFEPGSAQLFPHPGLYRLVCGLTGLSLLGWISFEVRRWQRGAREINRILSVGLPSLLQVACFLWAKNPAQVLWPLLAMHGVAYIALMSQTLSVRGIGRMGVLRAVAAVLLTVALGGIFHAFMDGKSPTASLLGALVGAPSVWHYLVDGWIWRRQNFAASIPD